MMLEGVCLQEDLVTIFIQEPAPFSLQDSFAAFGFFFLVVSINCTSQQPPLLYQWVTISWFSALPSGTLPLTAYQGCRFHSKVLVLVVRRSNRALSQTPTALQAELYLASSPEMKRGLMCKYSSKKRLLGRSCKPKRSRMCL